MDRNFPVMMMLLKQKTGLFWLGKKEYLAQKIILQKYLNP